MKKIMTNMNRNRLIARSRRGIPALLSLLITGCTLLSIGASTLEAAPTDRSRFRDTQNFKAHDRYDQIDRRGQRVSSIPSGVVRVRLGWQSTDPATLQVDATRRSQSVLRAPETRRPAVELLVERWNPSIPPWHTTAQGYGMIIPDLAKRPEPGTERAYEEDEDGPALQDYDYQEWYLGAVAPGTTTDP